jgi:hypothetical protein
MFRNARKGEVQRFKGRDVAKARLFIQNVSPKDVDCGFDPPYHGGWGMRLTTGEGIVVRLDRHGHDLNGARHDEAGRRIVTTKPGERIWALGEWHTVAGVAVHSAVSPPPRRLQSRDGAKSLQNAGRHK